MSREEEVVSAGELEQRLITLSAPLPPEARPDTVLQLYHVLTTSETESRNGDTRPIHRDLFDSNKHFALKRSDMSIVEEIITIAAGLAGALIQPATVIAPLCVFLLRYRRLRIPINGEQALILRTMRNEPERGWRPDEIAARLPARRGRQLQAAKVSQILASLTQLRRHGQRVPLVEELDGRWEAKDV